MNVVSWYKNIINTCVNKQILPIQNNQSLIMKNKADKMIIRGFLLASAVIVLICLVTPASSLPLEGAFGENENRFRFRAIPSSDIDTPTFLRKRRRTLPFQLMSQPEPPIYVNSNRFRGKLYNIYTIVMPMSSIL